MGRTGCKRTLLCSGMQVNNSRISHSKGACLYPGLHINNAGRLGFPAVLLGCSFYLLQDLTFAIKSKVSQENVTLLQNYFKARLFSVVTASVDS